MIKPTSDRKTRKYKAQKNTFGLLPGVEGTCPGATTAPGGCWHIAEGRKVPDCYVANLMKGFPGVRDSLTHNTKALMKANFDEKVTLLTREFGRFHDNEMRRKARGETTWMKYRLHWSGDIFDKEYAEALAVAINFYPDIEFWGYTRSFFAVDYLKNEGNLTLYLSLDSVNVFQGVTTYMKYAGKTKCRLRMAYMGDDDAFDDCKARFKTMATAMRKTGQGRISWDNNLTLVDCPVDAGKMDLEGGCAKCRLCNKAKPVSVCFRLK